MRANWLTVAPLPLIATTLLAVSRARLAELSLTLVGLWLIVLWRIWRTHGETSPPAPIVLGVAALLRLLALPLPQILSDDVYRYVWDGRLVVEGYNPYALAPDDPVLRPLRDELWGRVAHRDVETVYPPAALGLFSIASRSRHPVVVLKTLLAGFDLVACWLLLVVARGRGLPSGRSLAYAWGPLAVVEVAGMGHVDALGVAAVLGGAAALAAGAGPARRAGRERPAGSEVLAGLCVGIGSLGKLIPLFLLPAWARAARRPLVFTTVAVGLLIAAFTPVVWSLGGLPPGLVTYGVSWEFNGPIFEPLWRGLATLRVASAVKVGLAALGRWTGTSETLGALQHWIYPQLLAKILLAACFVGVLVRSAKRRSPEAGALTVLGAWILLSATVYPWYLLWVLPWACLAGSAPWLLLSGTTFFSYLPRLFGVALLPWPYLLVWAPPLALWAWRRRTD